MQHSPRKFWEVWGRSDALYNRWAAAHGVNNYRLFVLYVLDNHPGATQKAIADHAGLPKQTVNTVVRALRDEGYVIMLGRRGAYVADAPADPAAGMDEAALESALTKLATEFKASGGTRHAFLAAAKRAARNLD